MFERAITALITKEDRFYADFIQQMDKIADSNISTAAVAVDTRIKLYYNPSWWQKLDLPMQIAVLKHECAHVICEHMDRVKQYGPDRITHGFYNFCMDLAVNSTIGFPDSWTDPESGQKMEFATIGNLAAKYPTCKGGMPFEYYVNYFKEEEQGHKQFSEMIKNMEFDDHKGMYDKEPGDGQRQVIKYAINQALESSKRAGNGPPAGLRDYIKKILTPGNDWGRQLRRFPEDSEVVNLEGTRKVRNRRYGTMYPGDRKVRRKKGVLGFDVSGSITQEVAAALMANVQKILDNGVELTVLFFGTGVVREETWTKTPNLENYQLPDGGGTLFNPVYERANKLNADFLIMLTDGYNFDSERVKTKCPTLFGIIGNKEYKSDWAKVIFIDDPAAA